MFYVENQLDPQRKNTWIAGNLALVKIIADASKTSSVASLQENIKLLMNANLKIGNHEAVFNLLNSPQNSVILPRKSFENKLVGYLKSDETPDFSLPINKGEWLNYHTQLSFNFYLIALILILLEICILSMLVFYAWIVWRFTLPLRHFKKSAEKLGIDMNVELLDASGPLIVKETALVMNRMQKRIQDLINTRTKMLAAISHDLRTPITRLKLQAQFIDNVEQSQKINANLDEMEMMIASILNFSKHDSTLEKNVTFDISSLLQSICYDFQDLGRDVTYEAEVQREVIYGRLISLKRTFTNLIENGIKYGNKVVVKLISDKQKIIITIEDYGSGLPEEDLKKVFEAYYRSSQSIESNISGTGLGLTIAHEVILAHEGEILLENREEKSGLRVTIKLPRRHQPISLPNMTSKLS